MSLELKFQAGFETERQGCKRSDTVKYSFVLYVLQKMSVNAHWETKAKHYT